MKAILYISFFLLIFSSCNFSLNRSRQYSIVSPEESINNIPADDFFYINLKSAYYTGEKGTFDPLDFMIYALDDGPGTDCKIPVSQEGATEDLYCIMEVMEGDLWLHEINLEYSVPPGLCEYLGFIPHWHYNYRSGIGPLAVAKVKPPRNGEEVTEFDYVGCKTGDTKTDYYYYCSNKKCKNKKDCESGIADCNDPQAGTWTNGFCSNADCNNRSDCLNDNHRCNGATAGTWNTQDGTCTNTQCDNESDCENINSQCNEVTQGTWTAGSCTNTKCADPQACESISNPCNSADAGTWDPYPVIVCKNNVDDARISKKPENTCPYGGTEQSDSQDEANEKQINCCSGRYTLYEDEDKDPQNKIWKRDPECIGGLARMNWDLLKKEDSLPKTKITRTKGRQFDDEYTLEPLIDEVELKDSKRYSLPTANYFSDIREENSLPGFYQPATNGISQGNPFITVSCLDSAYEVKHIIKMIIREWNTQEEFIKFKESNGSRGDPDTDGDEGSGCDYYDNNSMFSKCNDLTDADDQGDAYPELVYIGSGGGSSD